MRCDPRRRQVRDRPRERRGDAEDGDEGSAKEWTATVEEVLKLEFDTVVPGHGSVATKRDLITFRDGTKRLTELVSQLVAQGKSRADIEQVMRREFGWQDCHAQLGLDGLIDEMK